MPLRRHHLFVVSLMQTHVPKQQIAFLSTRCTQIIEGILDDFGVDAEIDKEIVLDLTEFFLRDIYRIDRQQRGSISVAKFAGYWGFWIRKLKPLSQPKPIADCVLEENEIKAINEYVAVVYAVKFLIELRGGAVFDDHVSQRCREIESGACDGMKCVSQYTEKYMNFENRFFLRYIVYSMRHRTFGPHHFALLIETLIFGACSGLTE